MRKITNLFTLTFIIFFIVSCSGGSSSPSYDLPESSSSPVHPLVWEVVSPSSVGMNENKLKEAFDSAFADGTFTQSAIVIKDGKLVYERYRGILEGEKTNLSNLTGIDAELLQLQFGDRDRSSYSSSWSSAKSFASFLIGIAESEGFISSINDSASIYISEWANDDRASITIKNILDMRSGLTPMCFDSDSQGLKVCSNLVDSSSGGNIIYSDDQLTGCINRDLAESGVIQPWFSETEIYERGDFQYSNCDTNVLGEIIFRATGQDPQTFADYYLFSKINMNAIWWKDFQDFGHSNGNILSYCCLDATARDYAKFGYMLLLGGIWEGNSLSYNSYVSRIRNLESYGLQFWKICAKTHDENGNCPNNSFIHSTIGFDGQYIMIDFARNIVVVRSSLYEPILNASDERKMKLIPNDLSQSNWILTLPRASGASINSNFYSSGFYDLITQAIE